MEVIKFVELPIGFQQALDLTDLSKQRKAKINFLAKRAGAFNGYFAGGFVERLAYQMVVQEYQVSDDYKFSMKFYLNDDGDIDIFFNNQADFEKCAKELSEDIAYPVKNNSHAAVTFEIDNDGILFSKDMLKVQIIKYRFGKPEECLNTFDIYNAACYVDYKADKIFVPHDFASLVKSQAIKLHDFKSLNKNHVEQFQRLLRWLSSHIGYKSIEPLSNRILADRLIEGVRFIPKFFDSVSILSFLTRKIFRLPPDALILIASLLPKGDYPQNNKSIYDVLHENNYV